MHVTFGQTLALALGAGSLVSLLCARMRIPAVLPLLVAGVALGRSGAGIVDARALGSGLQGIITVAVALLVFEGGLHLRRGELAHAPRAVIGLLTVGALITWVGGALLGRYVLGLAWPMASLLGAILIVTGPTVIQPILRRVALTPPLHMALSAEAVLIDPLGVIASIVSLEIAMAYAADPGAAILSGLGTKLLAPFVWGGVVGSIAAGLAWVGLRALGAGARTQAAHLNLLALAACMVSAGVGEAVAPEAGLVAATLCAVIMANARVLGVAEMRAFKEQLSTLAVGALFILIASTIDLQRIRNIGAAEAAFVVALLLIVRPLSVALSTAGSRLARGEVAFAALFAPRGVVAASMASIAAAQFAALAPGALSADSPAARLAAEAASVETVVLLVIFVSVIWGSLFAGRLARVCRVRAQARAALIVGAHPLGVATAKALEAEGVKATLIDTNDRRVERAAAMGLKAIEGDATDLRWLEDVAHEHGVGAVIAWTGNSDVDRIVVRWALDRFPPARVLEGFPNDRLPVGVEPGWSALETAMDLVADAKAHVAFARPEPGAVAIITLADRKAAAPPATPSAPASATAPGPVQPSDKGTNGKPAEKPPAPPPTLMLLSGAAPAPPPPAEPRRRAESQHAVP